LFRNAKLYQMRGLPLQWSRFHETACHAVPLAFQHFSLGSWHRPSLLRPPPPLLVQPDVVSAGMGVGVIGWRYSLSFVVQVSHRTISENLTIIFRKLFKGTIAKTYVGWACASRRQQGARLKISGAFPELRINSYAKSRTLMSGAVLHAFFG
jgi:hypothetical protein